MLISFCNDMDIGCCFFNSKTVLENMIQLFLKILSETFFGTPLPVNILLSWFLGDIKFRNMPSKYFTSICCYTVSKNNIGAFKTQKKIVVLLNCSFFQYCNNNIGFCSITLY